MVNSLAFLKPYIVSFLSDYGFKVTFGDKKDTLFARKAIEFIIEDNHPILSLNHLRNEFSGLSVDARAGLYDIIYEDEHKRIFIVEMQVDNYDHLLERLQLYGFHVFTSLPKKGKQGFQDIGVVHCICIIKDAVTPSEDYHQVVTLKNQKNEIVMDNIVFHLIELAKFPFAKKDVAKIKTEKEELLYTMKYAHKYDLSKDDAPVFWEKEHFKRPLKRLDISKMSPLDAALYKNMQIRVDAAENILEKKFNQRVDAAVEAILGAAQIEMENAKIAAIEVAKLEAENATIETIEAAKIEAENAKIEAIEAIEAAKIAAKIEAENAKIESIKKFLLLGKATKKEIAEAFGVSVEFVKTVEASLKTSSKSPARSKKNK